MSNKQTNPLTDWELPTIWDIIDRMEFKYLFGEEKKSKEVKKKRKYTKRSKKKS
tara:strand:- start:568 stop:729 length:162 start_codon:yes stop_codon:yes gene_type:complete